MHNNACQCREPYDYRIDGLKLICQSCGSVITHHTDIEISNLSDEIAHWLAGEIVNWLPEIPTSYRWGLIHWWVKIKKTETLETDSFATFWKQ